MLLSKTDQLIFNVTKENIDKSTRVSPERCMLAQALNCLPIFQGYIVCVTHASTNIYKSNGEEIVTEEAELYFTHSIELTKLLRRYDRDNTFIPEPFAVKLQFNSSFFEASLIEVPNDTTI